MRRERVARALLKLYPPAWRARYGDELLAFLEDSGLTLRVVVDVVAAATVERVRSMTALFRDDTDLVSHDSQGFRKGWHNFLTFVSLSVAFTLLLVSAGLPWPGYFWWWNSLWMWTWRDYPASSSGVARGLASFLVLVAAVALTAVAWIVGRLVIAGRVEPATLESWFVPVGVAYLSVGVLRSVYILYEISRVHIRWTGVSQTEIVAWRIATFVILTVLLQIEPTDGEGIWAAALCLWIVLNRPSWLTPAGVRKRRANHEKIYGAPTAAASPPDQPA